jgi:hypothetical protein
MQSVFHHHVPLRREQLLKCGHNFVLLVTELGLEDGQFIYVADVTTPNSLTFQLHMSTGMEN